jgi:NAD(P)H dehydrogenase (quinone)
MLDAKRLIQCIVSSYDYHPLGEDYVMPTIGLIGATGNVGLHMLDLLAPLQASGAQNVRVAVRSAKGRAAVDELGLTPLDLDLGDYSGLAPALEGIDTLFFLRPYSLEQIMHGKRVIDAARSAGVSTIVSIGAHGAPGTPWSVIGWNFLVEAYAERSGLDWIHLRPNFFMETLLAQYDPVRGVVASRMTASVSWIAAEDIAAAAVAVLLDPARHAGRAYTLATEAATMAEIASTIGDITGRDVKLFAPTRDQVMPRLLAQGREPYYAEALLDYQDAVNAGLVPEVAEVSDAVETLAGRPATALHDFLALRLTPAGRRT